MREVHVSTARAVGALSTFALTILLLPAVLFADVRRNDFFQFWWVGHLVAIGKSPYEPASFRDALVYGSQAGSVYTSCAVSVDAPACLWVYPPWTPWLYAPIGLLDRAAGTIAVLVLAVISLAAPRAVLLAALLLLYVGRTWFPLFAARLWEDGNRTLGLVPVATRPTG